MTFIPKKPESGPATEAEIDSITDDASKIDVIAAVEEKLKETYSAESDDSTPEPKEKEKPAESDDSTPEKEEEEEEESEATKDEEVIDKDEDAPGKGTEQKTEKPPISDAYYRAAIHMGWTNEEVDNLHESNPELCEKTLAKVYEGVNRVTKDFSAIGRYHKEQATQTEQVATESVRQVPATPDMTKLIEQYGEDDPMVKTVETLQKLIEQQGKQLEQQRTTQPRQVSAAQGREREALGQQIDVFFKDESKLYGDFYGKVADGDRTWDELTPGQNANRMAVIRMADEMRTGAQALGRELKWDEALSLSHISVSAPLRERVVRERITKTVTKRSKSLSLKPSSSVSKPSGKSDTRTEFVQNTQQKLDTLFGK